MTTETEKEIFARIAARKKELGEKLLILGHHYQHEDVFQFADLTGDSLKLSADAAKAGKVKYIVFCGVYFMAEAADILTAKDQLVLLPELTAGCPMADMAPVAEVEKAWQELNAVSDSSLVPVTYVNSSARLKAFVGERGGSVCTSSNGERVLNWALKKGGKVFFFPDEHLGRNSAQALGLDDSEVVLWQRGLPLGGNSETALARARVILWNGFCHVHMEFSAEQVKGWREKEPGIKVIIHPESRSAAVQAADKYGSTEGIISAVEKSPAGAAWAIGTEVNLVRRLQKQHKDKKIHLLADTACSCPDMAAITPAKLLWVLDNLTEGKIVNQVKVPADVAAKARLALERMLDI